MIVWRKRTGNEALRQPCYAHRFDAARAGTITGCGGVCNCSIIPFDVEERKRRFFCHLKSLVFEDLARRMAANAAA